MPSIVHTLKTKGIKKTLGRFYTLFSNVGISSDKIHKNISDMVQLCNSFDYTPSFPITSVVYQKHKDLIDNIHGKFEICAHGLTHVNHRELSYEKKIEDLNSAFSILSNSPNFMSGFRAPYLSRDSSLSKALKQSNFLYDSSFNTFTNYSQKNNADLKKVLNFYNSEIGKYIVPYDDEGIIQIPVNLPDDQMLIDIENFSSDKIFKIWKKILLETVKNKTIFVLQLHPERFHKLEKPLTRLLHESEKYNIWKANLSDISNHFRSNKNLPSEYVSGLSITGDIDVLNLKDYFLMYGN